MAQSSFRVGHMGTLKSTHPYYYAVQVLTKSSRQLHIALFSSVRTAKGLAYSVGGASAAPTPVGRHSR